MDEVKRLIVRRIAVKMKQRQRGDRSHFVRIAQVLHAAIEAMSSAPAVHTKFGAHVVSVIANGPAHAGPLL
jgi:hypothetical protein